MKKHGFGSRLLSLLLTAAMVLPMLSLDVLAAEVGDIGTGEKVGDTGLNGDIDTSNTISWPIKIYDYLNDGMLFEYANAGDSGDIADDLGGAYGGGTPAPQFNGAAKVIGNDYTIDKTYTETAYTTNFAASAYWYTGSKIAAKNFVDPMHLRVVLDSKCPPASVLLSNFGADNKTFYDKTDVQYAVIVYRTNGLSDSTITLNWRLSDGTTEYNGSAQTFKASSDWTYVVYDMKTGAINTNWSSISGDVVDEVRFTFPLTSGSSTAPTSSYNGQYIDISHIAYFDTAFEAKQFGIDAVAFDKDPGEYLNVHTEYSDTTITVPVENPSFTYGADYTNAASIKDPSYTEMILTKSQKIYTNSNGSSRYYIQVTDSDSYRDYSTVASWDSEGISATLDNTRYAVLVYRTTGLNASTQNKIAFYLKGTTSGMWAYGAGWWADQAFTVSNGTWTYAVFDMADATAGATSAYSYNYKNDIAVNYSKVGSIAKVGIYFPGFTSSSQSMDISHICFFSSRSAAETFGKQALAYVEGETTTSPASSYTTDQKKWNTGNNVAFSLLYAGQGGGWSTVSGNNMGGGASTAPSGYYSYGIGAAAWSSAAASEFNSYRTTAGTKGYPVSNSIFLLSGGALINSGETYDMSELKLGYTLRNYLSSGVMTAGLLESSLTTVTANGKTYRVPNYKEDTIEYIAYLLRDTLIIPETDASGNYNYNYVQGTANGEQYGYDPTTKEPLDLASALRQQLGITFTSGKNYGTIPNTTVVGDYNTMTATQKAGLIGSFEKCKGNIKTFVDAAYYLLMNLYVDDSYNQAQDEYNYLVLSSATLDDGNTAYVFDGGFTTGIVGSTTNTENYRNSSTSAVKYDTTNGTISLTSATSKDKVYFSDTETTTRFPFLPVTDSTGVYEGETHSPYFLDDGRGPMGVTEEGATFVNRNYNYAMAANGEFIYHEDDDLFFEFEGDDDVYLFINGELVLDIGAAHSVTDVKMNVNDYVTDARAKVAAGTATEREKKLALAEGESYSFDFYYMERHGWGANCRIATNIRITDPDMKTEKTAYQDGVEVEYGGVINPDEPIEYSFSLTNSGNSKLYNLSFSDNDIGLTLDSTKGLTITGTHGTTVCDVSGGTLEVTDLVAYVTGTSSAGAYNIKVTFADNDALIEFLKNLEGPGLQQGETADTTSGGGLWTDATVTIRGFAYKMTDEQKAAGVFDNTVITQANTQSNGNGKTLSGNDNHRVYVIAEPMYYQWAGHPLTVTKDKLIEDVLAAADQSGNTLNGQVTGLTKENITSIKLVNKLGAATTSPYVTVNSDSSLTIKYTTPSSYVFYVQVTYNNGESKSVKIPVLVNVTDVENSVIVLDYGLKAELTKSGTNTTASELFKNDTLTVPARDTDYMMMGLAGENSEPSYGNNQIVFTPQDDDPNDSLTSIQCDDGKYVLSSNTLSYIPTAFMENLDTIWVAVTVYDKDLKTPSDLGSININKEVQMYKSVTTLPATVVYYEDYFPTLKYVTSTSNIFNPVTPNTEPDNAPNQGTDQDQEYGQDDAYKDNSSSSSSAGSIVTVTINESGPVAYFTFVGSGFELISRTNATDSATIEIEVYEHDTSAESTETSTAKVTVANNGAVTVNNATLVKRIPVITEFDNGANDPTTAGGSEVIYQVPVVRVDDLGEKVTNDETGEVTAINPKQYTVVISGVPAYDFSSWVGTGTPDVTSTTLYIDGLRIFQPLGDENENYNANENGATFVEIRDLIVGGTAAAVKYVSQNLTIGTGTVTWTENRIGKDYTLENTYEGNVVSSANDYLMLGPDNEVYMNGTFETSALVFYVTEKGTGAHNLQIAVHAVDQGLFYGSDTTGMNTELQYGTKDEAGNYVWAPLVTVTSGTEQYYTIDYTKCPLVDGKYQVVINVATGMVSFTTLKFNGLNIESINGTAATLRYDTNGALERYNTTTKEWEPVIDDPTMTIDDYPAFQPLSLQMRAMTLSSPGSSGSNTPDIDEPTIPDDTEDSNDPSTGGSEGDDSTGGSEDDSTGGSEGDDSTGGSEDDSTGGSEGDDSTGGSEEDGDSNPEFPFFPEFPGIPSVPSTPSRPSNTVTEITENRDGSVTTTVTNIRTGKVTVTTEYPSGAVVKSTSGSSVIEVDIPRNTIADVVIPAENVTSGTVVVVVHSNGVHEVLQNCIPVEGGVAVTLDSDARVIVVDMTMSFIDVSRNAWFRDAVDFVSARGLMTGTGQDIFGHSETTTRAMVWTMLARLNGTDTSGVSPWYARGQAWAMNGGVSDGSDPNGSITREQLAVMLWRQAGSPAVRGNLAQFADAEKASSWAQEALVWAVKKGVLSGMGDGTLSPGSTATRAQVAQMLMNYLTNIR